MKAKEVFIFTNGLTIIFDENGNQIPELQQGNIFDMRKILENSDINTKFHFSKFQEWSEELNLEWVFEEVGKDEQ